MIRSRSISRGQVTSWTTPEGASVLVPIPERVQEVVASLYAPQPAGDTQDGDGAPRVQMRNGTERAQLGVIAADRLRWEGIKVVETGPAEVLLERGGRCRRLKPVGFQHFKGS